LSVLSTGQTPAEAILYKVAAGIGQHRNQVVADCGSLARIASRGLKIVSGLHKKMFQNGGQIGLTHFD
jgi:anti-anti-sigma regulatory factor